MSGDGVQEHSSDAQIAILARYDHVKDNGLVHEVGEDACERRKPARIGITEGEDQIRVLDCTPDVIQSPATAPPFALIHSPQLNDLLAGEAIHELQSGFG